MKYFSWLYIERQKKQKFDDISKGHEAALIAMGIIEKAERKELKGPECPPVFYPLLAKYRAIKFQQRETADQVVVYPRGMLSWGNLQDFKAATGTDVSFFEADLIMALDAVFEGRDDG